MLALSSALPRYFLNAVLFGVGLSLYGWWVIKPIVMTTADLGRHIATGRILVTNWTLSGWQVLTTNFYSYTHPDFLVINHHWGSGLLFYGMNQLAGLTSVHWLFIGVSVVTLSVWMFAAWRSAPLPLVLMVVIFLLPLLAGRQEVRPEVFSYLFAGLFYLLLWEYREGRLLGRWLWLLVPLQVMWVNLHVYFIFGIYFVALFWLESVLRQLRRYFVQHKGSFGDVMSPRLLLVLWGVVGASLFSPFHFKGLLYPFIIFRNYGYQIVENKSVLWLEEWGMENPNFLLIRIVGVGLLSLVMIVLWLDWRRVPLASIVLAITVWLMSWLAIRNFTFTALVLIPVLSWLLAYIWNRFKPDEVTLDIKLGWVVLVLIVVLGTYFHNYDTLWEQRRFWSVGPVSHIDGAIQFIKDHNLRGPIFNNYDIGSYLIYYLPEERVFVDNRPEAYPASFFEDVYIPMQRDDAVWQTQLEQHNFSMIIFSPGDLTDWGQQFLNHRLRDSEWAPVYFDGYVVIFLRTTDEWQSVISAYRVPLGRS